MKEYKVVSFPVKITFNQKKYFKELEEFLNGYARQGWSVTESNASLNMFILERER